MSEIWIERRRHARLFSFASSAVMLALAAGLVAPPAFAQTAPASTTAPATPAAPPTKEQLAEAKKFFEAGMKLSKEGLYQEALASFLEANRLSPRESIQNNLARTYRLMKDMAGAYEAYETLLAKYGDKMKPALKSDAQHALEELEVLTGVIAIGVQEPGAKVTIDGKDAGQTPLPKPVRVNVGPHQLSIAKDGFDTLAQQVDIRGHDSVPVNGPLVKTVLTGHLTVAVKQTTPADPTVKIFVDGKDVGAPPYQADLDPGSHTLEAKGDTAVSTQRQIQVDKKGTYSETLDLHVQQGTIAVNVDVADSEIAIDGKTVAHGVYEGVLPLGTHVLTVAKTGFAQYRKELIVHDGEKVVENVALQKEGPGNAAAAPHDWKGIYSQLNFVGQFEVTTPSNDIAQGVGYTPSTSIAGSGIFGGGINVRVGYSLGFIGIEGSVLLGYDHSSATAIVSKPGSGTVTHPYPSGATDPVTENYDFSRVGGNVGLGVRFMPKTQIVRPTVGIGGGLSMKAAFYDRSMTFANQNSDLKSNPAFYVAPSFMADAGIELGSTPGARFYLGCLLMADFSSGAASTPQSSYSSQPPAPTQLNVANGTDLFIGPILGLQFGE